MTLPRAGRLSQNGLYCGVSSASALQLMLSNNSNRLTIVHCITSLFILDALKRRSNAPQIRHTFALPTCS